MLLGYTASDLAGCALLGLRESIAFFGTPANTSPSAVLFGYMTKVVRGRAMELEVVWFGTGISAPLGSLTTIATRDSVHDGR